VDTSSKVENVLRGGSGRSAKSIGKTRKELAVLRCLPPVLRLLCREGLSFLGYATGTG